MSKREEGSNEGAEKDEGIMKIWDCGSPLYDSYELVSVGHVIDRHLMALPFLGGSRRVRKQVSHSSTVIPPAGEERGSRRAEGSSMVGCLGVFLGRNVWKRREKEERGEKPKKVNVGFCRIYGRVTGSWRK